ncbi:MAG: RibD family protein, partial [Synechococcus sp.]|nr:RibD family protein [Synechococcus sp.]
MLKVAQSLDGRIATSTGDSQWISGHANLRWVHRVRAAFDAVLVGAGTARVDDPQLTVRHVQGRHPRRIVLDGNNNLSRHLALFQPGTGGSTLHVTATDPNAPGAARDVQNDHLTAWHMPGKDGHVDLPKMLARLGTACWGVPFRPVQSLLV